MKSESENNYLNQLKNEELTEIDFVQDYYQLVLDDIRISVLIKSSLICNGERIPDDSALFPSKIISCINSFVNDVRIIEAELLVIHFSNETILEISLKAEDHVIPEGIMITSSVHMDLFVVL